MKHTIIVFLCALVGSVSAQQGADFPLIRNGDFRLRQSIGPDLRQSWLGGRGIKFEEATDRSAFPSILMEGNAGAMFQNVDLIPGEYELSAGVKVSSTGRAVVKAGKASVEQTETEGWRRVSVRFVCDGSPVRVVLAKGRPAKGTVRFRDVRVKALKLESESAPVADGQALGRIVAPADPKPAETFAAWELQRFVWRMTGRTPGLDGRDETFPGRTVFIGRAARGAAVQRLEGLKKESYVVASDEASLNLAGNSPRGTLYAVYDFLKTQGCRWYLPGTRGEVVPKRAMLDLPEGVRVETPDWGDARGILVWGYEFRHNGRREYVIGDELFDWLARNRFNALWQGGKYTIDLGAHRGHGPMQRLNHSWHSFYPKDGPPEWAALVNGKRTRRHSTGRPNMMCTSNPDYRDAVVQGVLQYFQENPQATAYSVSADDGPVNWCECRNCRAQDQDFGKQEWKLGPRGMPPMFMTDRAIHFVNEVADRISKVYPDKLIEIYSYQQTGLPPERHRIHPNVRIKITYRSFSPARHSLADTNIHHNTLVTTRMNDFAAAGAKQFGLYDYGSYLNRDCPIFWFFPIVDSLKVLHEKWGFEHFLGETDNTLGPSMIAYQLRARALWNTQIDYQREVEDICRRFYGPAADEMLEYNLFMHDAMLRWEPTEPDHKGRMFSWVGKEHAILGQYSLDTLARGQAMLDRALAKVRGDETLEGRIGIAQFGHSQLVFYVARRSKPQTRATVAAAKTAHARVIGLWGVNGNLTTRWGQQSLSRYVPAPVVEQTLCELPLKWSFRTDSGNVGLDQNWRLPLALPDEKWSAIRIDKDWTQQGHNHRGTAWYRVEFAIPAEARDGVRDALKSGKAKLHFGAIDGTADVFLNGELIGKQKVTPVVMWDKAFVIPLPPDLDVTVPLSLVVRVEKRLRGGAGIWKPVSIVVAE